MKDPVLVFEGCHNLAEGPVWCDGALWWVNIMAGELHRFELESKRHSVQAIDRPVGAAVPIQGHEGHHWMLATRDGFCTLDFRDGVVGPTISAAAKPDTCRFNDGKCDAAGRFIAGTMSLENESEAGHLFSLEKDEARVLLDRVNLSNGLAWSADGKTLYYIDTPTRRVDAMDYDIATGGVKNRRTIREFRVADGWPDGMTIDSQGNLWVAFWEGSAVHAFRSSDGEYVTSIHLPCSRVTCCTFGGPNLDILYITTAWQGAEQAERENEPLAGSIFSAVTGTTGFPSNSYVQA